MTEPSLDELWEPVAASLSVAEEHEQAIYRDGNGVPGPEALAGIQKHIAAGLAARVMYERLRFAEASGDHAEHFDPDCEECAYLARPTRETLGITGAAE